MSGKIAVVGGGISGLSAAYALMKGGRNVTVLERNPGGGGAIRTMSEEGYLYECGPNSTMNSNDEIDTLCRELGLEGERIFGSETSKKRYVMRGGRLIHLPMGLVDSLTTPLWSGAGKLRLLKEPFVGRATDPEESVAGFVSRRIGQELLDYALDPFVSGVYAGDPARLELKSTFPKMAALEDEYGSLILGALWKAFKGGARSTRQKGLFSFRKGMETLPAAITARLGDRFCGGREVKALERQGEGYLLRFEGGGSERADEVILSSPAYALSGMVRPLSSEMADLLDGIEYAPIAVVYLGFDRKAVTHLLDGFGCLIPGREGKKLLGSLWSSSLFPGRAPEGRVSLTCFIGGARNRPLMEKGDGEILDLVLRDLTDTVGLEGAPVFSRVIRHSRAIPQYTIGHGKRLAALDASLRPFPGLHLLGNYLRGVSVADCVMNGIRLGERLTIPAP